VLLAYLGHDERLYLGYSDAATGRTLKVTPGGTYDVRAREPGQSLPPGDGRWGPASELPWIAPRADPWIGIARELTEPAEPPPPEPSALPALPENPGDGGQPAPSNQE
jgi:hypothetical protein